MLLENSQPSFLTIPAREKIVAWWNSLDKVLLNAFIALILIGTVLTVAAGPVAAMRKGISNPFHFVERQFVFLIPAVIVFVGTSMLSTLAVRRVGIILGVSALVGMILTLMIGPDVNGATRWLSVGGMSVQPSEFFKPGFAILAAWLVAESQRDSRFPGGVISFGFFALASAILVLQPDYGQLMLLVGIWGMIFFIAGWSWGWVMGLGATATGVLVFGYQFAPHVRSRIDRFFAPETGDTYQVDRSLETISGGGLLGHDLSHTMSVKESLPDAHTDFIFAVAGEEFGFVLCLVIIGLFSLIVLRSLNHASSKNSVFVRSAIAGLGAMFAFQAIVNIGVSLAVLPAKGMTLPFISYGGSSLLTSALAAGFLLALTKKSPEGRH
ncbi:MAG: FtsW/RodA/SpoVE family cell cycle protein [Parvularcula sp.]